MSVDHCLLHQELEQEVRVGAWMLSDMVLVLLSKNLGATIFGK